MARTNWQYDEVVTETDFNGIGQEINDNAADIAELQEELSPADPIPVTIQQGVSIVHAGRKSRFKDMKITGRTLVNLLGRDGNCEDVNRWVSYGNVSIATDSANKVYGNSSMKITINTGQTGGWMQHTVTWQANKYYIALAELKPVTAALMRLTVRGGSPTSTDITDTSKFSLAWLKYSVGPSAVASYIDVIVDNVTGTTGGQYGFADGVRIYEISQAEYSALDTMTAEQIAVRYPYVDDMKHVNAVYVENPGKNLLSPFSEWSISADATVLEPYKLRLNSNFEYSGTITKIPCVRGQTYTLSVDLTPSSSAKAYASQVSDTGGYTYHPCVNGKVTFTVLSNTAYLEVIMTNDTTKNVEMTFSKPMLNVGSTSLPFTPQQPSYMYLSDCQLRSNVEGSVKDELYTDGYGKPRAVRRFREIELMGNFPWAVDGLSTGPGYKTVYFRDYAILTSPDFQGTCIKYDGNVLVTRTSVSDTVIADSYMMYSNGVHVTITNADSGWGDSFTPSQNEIKAYFNGWKMSSTNNASPAPYTGTGDKYWYAVGSIPEGPTWYTSANDIGNPLNNPVTFTSRYRLKYQLAQSVDEPLNYEGELMLNDGENQIEIGTGVVVREAANPVRNANGFYYINHSSTVGSNLRYKLKRFVELIKSGALDKTWTKESGLTTNDAGFELLRKSDSVYDKTSAYSVTYLALDTYLLGIAPASITGAITPNIKETVDDAVQAIAGLHRDVSVLKNVKSDKQQPQWITATLLNGWVTEHPTLIPRYRVTTAGKLEFEGSMKNGIYSYGTLILKTPYKPKSNSRISVVCSVPNAVDIGAFVYDIDGNLVVEYLPSDGWVNLSGIIINLDWEGGVNS